MSEIDVDRSGNLDKRGSSTGPSKPSKTNVISMHAVVVHEKLVSSYRADFVGETQEDWRWLVYPWALVEDVGSFVYQLMPDALDRLQLEQRLLSKYRLRLSSTRLDHILGLYSPNSDRFIQE